MMFIYPGTIILEETLIHIIAKKQLDLGDHSWRKRRNYLKMFVQVVNPAVLVLLNIAFFSYGFSVSVLDQLNEFLKINNIA